MQRGERHTDCRRSSRRGAGLTAGLRAGGFTLIEVLISVAIIGILVSIAGLSMRGLSDRSVLAQAQNAVLAYAQVARSYAVTHQIETMFVVNPMNGRFEIWHLNPPAQGGTWDPLSDFSPDGYAFAPVLDPSARLPLDGNGVPMALVSPIDYTGGTPPWRPTSGGLATERYMDNFKWTAVCFDEHGQLVIRTRRIATRTFLYPDGTPRANPNRTSDETPDLTIRPLVIGGTNGDTPITSTCGLVISDLTKLRTAVDVKQVTPEQLVDDWLLETRPGGRYSPFAITVVLNRYSGDQQAKDR